MYTLYLLLLFKYFFKHFGDYYKIRNTRER